MGLGDTTEVGFLSSSRRSPKGVREVCCIVSNASVFISVIEPLSLQLISLHDVEKRGKNTKAKTTPAPSKHRAQFEIEDQSTASDIEGLGRKHRRDSVIKPQNSGKRKASKIEEAETTDAPVDNARKHSKKETGSPSSMTEVHIES